MKVTKEENLIGVLRITGIRVLWEVEVVLFLLCVVLLCVCVFMKTNTFYETT